jgi:hypothetical protein
MKAEHYLDYLDKEMSIMGVLSTFCLAVPSLFLERVISADEKSIAHDFLLKLWCDSWLFLVIATLMMFFRAVYFYKQRSRLAWYYGQIALKMALSSYTAHELEKWLKKADGWETWIPYHWAKCAIIFAVTGFTLAVLSVYIDFIRNLCIPIVVALLILFALLLIHIWRNSKRFNFQEKIYFFQLR